MLEIEISDILSFLTEQHIGFSFYGDEHRRINGFSSLTNYKQGTLTWIKKKETYLEGRGSTGIACAIIQAGVHTDIANAVYVDNSKNVFFSILSRFWGNRSKIGTRGEGTVISPDAHVDATATIGCNCSIVGDITIGEGTVIEHNVVIQGRIRIGKNCYIQSSVVIGIDGYGYSRDKLTKKKKMVEHFGGVVIGDDVFIGSHTNIARGTIDDTVIGNGVKIAPSTHIGHNSKIGEDTSIICSTLYGSVKIGRRSYITDSTIENQTSVGDDTVIGMGSVVTKPIGNNLIAFGMPAREIRENDSGL